MNQSIVLIGTIKNGIPTTVGTGFLITYFSKIYVVTCRHVIYEAGFDTLFAITNPKMTKTPSPPYKVLQIKKLHFHRDDSWDSNYDVVVCELLHIPNSELKKHNLSFVSVNSRTQIKAPENGDKIIGFGFPIEYTESILASNKEDRMFPYETFATVLDLPILGLKQNGFVGNVKEGFFAQTINNQDPGKGNSGGLVIIENKNEPYGVILGGAMFENENTTGIVFASFKRVIEILQDIK